MKEKKNPIYIGTYTSWVYTQFVPSVVKLKMFAYSRVRFVIFSIKARCILIKHFYYVSFLELLHYYSGQTKLVAFDKLILSSDVKNMYVILGYIYS